MILVAIGSNLPDPARGLDTPMAVCEAAVTALRALPDLTIERVSPWYETAPVPRSDQPNYCNGVVRFEGEIAPEALLSVLQGIELRFGRERSVANAARTLDLDIVAMGAALRDAPDPILPHPRATQRGFVLLPLRDVAPDWIDPRSGVGIEALIAALLPE
ncbi:2-amino-4-hydroxy-6-hydroxymethyldihydropteridine diphosphokinase [Acetobacteraceae bacterium KSS8]|uniref:2-amino-4-hydroxy-6-hydroxymethyldihydropteridine pyrophosphokinase n=2 Tax=Endosaccharibacter trunci TaxID=2812733 RepID=A0ABT1W3B0_9PROT|nr:2-amino-4-hydroxy-6-hydroxymethyldihydropteridine diphosphokinase [Acetobacteraceae bacterium KSS8]